MTTAGSRTFPHITLTPGVVGGEPVIKGTRVPVRSIVILYRLYGDLDRVHAAFPGVSSEAAREALEYYEAHQDEIDRSIAEDEDVASATSSAESCPHRSTWMNVWTTSLPQRCGSEDSV